MKYQSGKVFVRKKGQPRTDKYERYLRAEDGSASWDLKGKNVIFTGQNGKTLNLDLTIGKEYKIIKLSDNDPNHNAKGYYVSEFEFPGCFQHPGRVIVIINDKNQKKKYYENLFKLSDNQPEIKKEEFIEKFASNIFKVGDMIFPRKEWSWGSFSGRNNFNRHSRHTITKIEKNDVTLDNGYRVYINPYRNDFLKVREKT